MTHKTIAYIRVSTDRQDVDKQRLEILDYARQRAIIVNDIIEIEISSRRSMAARRIDELFGMLQEGDTLIVSELSRLGRSVHEVLGLVNDLIIKQIRFIAIKQNLDLNGPQDITAKVMITLFSLMAELERDLISARTKSALAAVKASGKHVGRPHGSYSRSILDGHEEQIKMLLSKDVSKTSIAKILNVSRGNLIRFINTRNLAA